MSGHSKWATIKRKKGAADAKRGQVFTRLTREIVMAAREGGVMWIRISACAGCRKARSQNMPKENIERAIKRELVRAKMVWFEQVFYEDMLQWRSPDDRMFHRNRNARLRKYARAYTLGRHIR